MVQTSKIFVEFATVAERDRAAPIVRSFLEMVFERGLRQAREGTDTLYRNCSCSFWARRNSARCAEGAGQ